MKDEQIKINIVSVKLVKEEKSLYCKITKPLDVVKVIKQLIGDEDREYLLVICLNVRNEINNISTVSIGSLNSSIVHPREVFKTAILSNSCSIILTHNHPGGSINPSNEDKNVTERIKEGGRILGIELLDHIIIGFDNPNYYSFKEQGII